AEDVDVLGIWNFITYSTFINIFCLLMISCQDASFGYLDTGSKNTIYTSFIFLYSISTFLTRNKKIILYFPNGIVLTKVILNRDLSTSSTNVSITRFAKLFHMKIRSKMVNMIFMTMNA